MPILKLASHSLHYQLDGPTGAPTLLLSNSLGTTLEMWRPQLPALSRHYRVLRYDTRGHGASTASAACRLADLAGDALSLLDALDIERAHFCGISMGGLTGLWLGVHAPERLQCLIVSNSAAKIGTSEAWRQRAAQVCAEGLAALAASAHLRWFSADFAPRRRTSSSRRAPGWRPPRRAATPPAARRWPTPTCAPTCRASPRRLY